MLQPDKARVARLLNRYRAWERMMLADPTNLTVRRRFEDTAYTLCVLMGRRNAREAALAAESYLWPSHRSRAQAQVPHEADT
ncbi:DUF5133 domain-containing protein [Streptomyces jeddahensis]|uniref:DUF5133 domain-containing protein n=1 Tax=Streptomyces jeddahensis TaxID=1716141 RepID=A0A177HNN5_9ACTN|nr:DUF5133 domain-containing protein [Streptomyces jeddahensis]OAH12622.1 hypothetical protein STSP_39680 [Streptomyces jeddahensis]